MQATVHASTLDSLGALATLALATFCLWIAAGVVAHSASATPVIGGPSRDPAVIGAAAAARTALLAKYGDAERVRIDRGVAQVVARWRDDDGDAAALQSFLEGEFLPQGETLEATFLRLESAMERVGGYFVSMARDLRWGLDVASRPQLPIDTRLAEYDPTAHVAEDLFRSKVAFVALLNFRVATLDEKLAEGPTWTRRQWAEVRLAERFATRVPAAVAQQLAQSIVAAEDYTNRYNVHLHHVLTDDGQRLFPPDLRLITHWGLRDELKGRYADRSPQGLARQRLIATVMERIVEQRVPRAVIDNPAYDWRPQSGQVAASPVASKGARPLPAGTDLSLSEDNARYARLAANFRAIRAADAYDPLYPTALDRRFARDGEIPLVRFEAILKSVLQAPASAEVGALIAQRLGRPLEPFDIWYDGFKPRTQYDEATLDAKTRALYPNAAAFKADLPRILGLLGFAPESIALVISHVEVDPSRGAGHALGPGRRDDNAHLRTRIGPQGMDYKGYNIAVHEFGHSVEQVFSTIAIDRTSLAGVPNNAFTEAMAFIFQARDLPLLGLSTPEDGESRALDVLDDFWKTREIAGVALVDIATWRWLYANPEATPAELKEAVVKIARDVWNEHYAPIFGRRDVVLLGIYSHMINYPLYLADYPLGHIIAFQVESHFAKFKGPAGIEFERMTKQGRLTPDLWMTNAVGTGLSAEPMLSAAREAVGRVRGGKRSY